MRTYPSWGNDVRNIVGPGEHRLRARAEAAEGTRTIRVPQQPNQRFGIWTRPLRGPGHTGWLVLLCDLFDMQTSLLSRQLPPGGFRRVVDPIVERAQRVADRLNRSTLAVAACELEQDGLRRLAEQCWKEDEQEYDE